MTNAVKHFRWEARGKRRLHKRPGATHIKACHPWLAEEIRLIEPKLIVCLGAVAARSMLGPNFRLTQHRGEVIDGAPPALATVHPSSILRARDDGSRRAQFEGFVDDLRAAAAQVSA